MRMRVHTLIGLCTVFVFSFVVGDGESGEANGAERRPNVLLMMADDLGWADLSCYGSTETSTPHLDQLAADGLKFTDFYAASGVCSPSRAAFMTGRFSVRAGVYSWIHTSHRMHLRREEVTIAELARSVGYRTAHFGKWHLGYDLEEGSGDGPDPGDHGFETWMATGNNANPSHRNPNNFVRDGVAVGPTEGYSCQLVVDAAIEWLDATAKGDEPFYLNLWFHEPHARVAAPERFRNRHLDKKNPDYYGSIENMDDAVGRLLEHLKKLGLDEETFVVFTSDNGSYMAGSNGELTGRKTTVWEGGIREPGIMRFPGHIKPGSVSHEPAGLVDLLPTVCDVVGAEVPRSNDRRCEFEAAVFRRFDRASASVVLVLSSLASSLCDSGRGLLPDCRSGSRSAAGEPVP